jgi:ABC-type branched-subunit amino acid transport system substrate-binding protein
MFQSFGRIFATGLALVLASAGAAAFEPGVSPNEIVLGQSLALTGPLSELGKDISTGTRAYFDSVNAHGGINGRRIKVVTLDDGYKVDSTVKNVQQLVGEDQVFALFNVMGTPNCAAILPMVDKEGVPFFSPFTGSDATRNPQLPGVFNVRASYRDEAYKIVQHLSTVGITKVGVVYQANAFGKDGMAAVEEAMARRGLKLWVAAPVQTDASDAAKAVATLHAKEPQSVILITAGKPTFEVIKAYNKVRHGMQFYTLSVMGAQANIKALGPHGVGVVVASVVPFPWAVAHPLVKEYQAAMQKIGATDYSFVSFESYINAKVLGEALRRAGKDLTRPKLVAAAEGMKELNFGGFDVNFGHDSRQGSRFVELTIISADGRFTK